MYDTARLLLRLRNNVLFLIIKYWSRSINRDQCKLISDQHRDLETRSWQISCHCSLEVSKFVCWRFLYMGSLLSLSLSEKGNSFLFSSQKKPTFSLWLFPLTSLRFSNHNPSPSLRWGIGAHSVMSVLLRHHYFTD